MRWIGNFRNRIILVSSVQFWKLSWISTLCCDDVEMYVSCSWRPGKCEFQAICLLVECDLNWNVDTFCEWWGDVWLRFDCMHSWWWAWLWDAEVHRGCIDHSGVYCEYLQWKIVLMLRFLKMEWCWDFEKLIWCWDIWKWGNGQYTCDLCSCRVLYRNSGILLAGTRDFLWVEMLVLGVLSWETLLWLVLITTGGEIFLCTAGRPWQLQ